MISIAEAAFGKCISLVTVIMGNGVTSIGNYGFHDYPNLTSINLPEGLTSIPEASFLRCSSLNEIQDAHFALHYSFQGMENRCRLTLLWLTKDGRLRDMGSL